MSTYSRETKHPKTGAWERATWYDDLFGNHNYGVVFPSDADNVPQNSDQSWQEWARSIAFDVRDTKLETRRV